jgi:hypothetical protein
MEETKTLIIVYTGTSITHSDARKILPQAEYRPPVRRGDILTAIREQPEIIGIIDGVFFDSAAVAHREILQALKAGVTVVGGASMGALRASELDIHGMIGAGTIYQRYREGTYVSDDEVAVTFDPETLQSLSTPLVNIRETLQKAADNNIITPSEQQQLIQLAQRIYYPDRSYQALLHTAGREHLLTSEKVEKLQEYIDQHQVDLKREDALAVLRKIKELATLKISKSFYQIK